jgi:hypothetical protein
MQLAILRKRLEGWAQRLDPRPCFETPRCAWLLRMRPEKSSLPAQAQPCDVAATKQPDGQISAFAVGQITFRTPGILSPRKGRWPSSRTLGRDAVDAAAACARWDGRAAFGLVSDLQDALTSGAEAYGEVVWS